VIVDGTLGGGGHSEALLEAGATVIGVDRDPRALEIASLRLGRFGPRFRAHLGTFGQLASLLDGPVDGLVLDLGVSSPQIDEPARGFSFTHDGPLDMRMSGQGETAAELICRLDAEALADVLFQFGDERFSRPIARELKARSPSTTFEAVTAVKAAVPRKAWPRDIHVATRTFQGLRIAVNQELEELEAALDAIPSVLAPAGRAAIISFHSLEDRMVKRRFRALCGQAPIEGPAALRIESAPEPGFFALTKKAVTATPDEVNRNPRSRSARLRAVEKVS
jgi:16S rRNA (cytosine1402-N4)-methyltransferase